MEQGRVTAFNRVRPFACIAPKVALDFEIQ
jgi:hypothetical protein